MKKLILLFALVFLAVSVSAATWDNFKQYDSSSRTLTIDNALGMGRNLATVQLTSPLDVEVGLGYQKVAEMNFINIDRSGEMFNDMKFYDLRNQKEEIQRDFDYRYEKVSTVEVPKAVTNCPVGGSYEQVERGCKTTTQGSELREVREWILFTHPNQLPPGSVKVGVFTNVQEGDHVDWVPTYFGRVIGEWASWTASLSLDLQRYYKMDGEFNSTLLLDFQENQNGSLVTGAVFNTTALLGPNATHYAGGSQYATIGTGYDTGDGTFNFWVKPDAASGVVFLLSDRSASGNYYQATIEADGTIGWRINDGSSHDLNSGEMVNTANYTMITTVWGSGGMLLYINGTQKDTDANTGSWTANTAMEIAQAAAFGGSNNYVGLVDEFGYWNRSLGSAEITAIYNGGLGINPSSIDSSATVLQNLPLNVSSTFNNPVNFSVNITTLINANVTNVTLELFNTTGIFNGTAFTTVSGNENTTANFSISSLNVGSYHWNALGCFVNNTGSFCVRSTHNYSFDYGYQFNSNTFNTPVGENSQQIFILNVTLASGLSASDSLLHYNNTAYEAIASTVGPDRLFTRTVTSPNVATATNIPFVWEIVLTDSGGVNRFNVTSGNQNVQPITGDFCTTHNHLILNYSIFNETNKVFLSNVTNNITFEVEVQLSPQGSGAADTILNGSVGINPIPICVDASVLNDTTYRLDTISRYRTPGHVAEYHHIQNFSLNNNTPAQNIALYDLAIADSQEFLITVKDSNFLPIPDALVVITRKYVEDAGFRTVEIPKTDTNGQTLGHFSLNDVIYNINILSQGKTIATKSNVVAFCDDVTIGDCRININQLTASINPLDLETSDNVVFNVSLDKQNRLISSSFNTIDGSTTTMNLSAVLFDSFGNTTICGDQLSSSAGTLSCNIPSGFGNVSVVTEIRKDGQFISQSILSLQQDPIDVFGLDSYVFLFLMVLTIPLMMIASGPAMIIGVIMGFIFGGLFNLSAGSSITSIGSSLVWLIIAGGVIIYKLEGRQ